MLATAHPAVVAKAAIGAIPEHYLQLTPAGATVWVADPQAATPFASMREATRMAMRLPASLRASSLPTEDTAH